MNHLNYLFTVKDKGAAKGLLRDGRVERISEALREVRLPSEFGRYFECLHANMQAIELRQVNLFLFPVLIDMTEPPARPQNRRGAPQPPPEPRYVRKVLLACLCFIARVALLPSYEFNKLDKAKCVYALSRWRDTYTRLIGEGYLGVNDASPICLGPATCT